MEVQSIQVLSARGGLEVARSLYGGAERTKTVTEILDQRAAQGVKQAAVAVSAAKHTLDRAILLQPMRAAARAASMKDPGSTHAGLVDVAV